MRPKRRAIAHLPPERLAASILLCTDGRELYPRFRDRIPQLATHAGSIGWGYGDFLREQVFDLEDELGES